MNCRSFYGYIKLPLISVNELDAKPMKSYRNSLQYSSSETYLQPPTVYNRQGTHYGKPTKFRDLRPNICL